MNRPDWTFKPTSMFDTLHKTIIKSLRLSNEINDGRTEKMVTYYLYELMLCWSMSVGLLVCIISQKSGKCHHFWCSYRSACCIQNQTYHVDNLISRLIIYTSKQQQYIHTYTYTHTISLFLSFLSLTRV